MAGSTNADEKRPSQSVERDSRQKLIARWAGGFGLFGGFVAIALVAWFYLSEAKETPRLALYYFGWPGLKLALIALGRAPETATTAKLFDALYIGQATIQWAILGFCAGLLSRARLRRRG